MPTFHFKRYVSKFPLNPSILRINPYYFISPDFKLHNRYCHMVYVYNFGPTSCIPLNDEIFCGRGYLNRSGIVTSPKLTSNSSHQTDNHLTFLNGFQGNLLKGIDNKTVKRQGIQLNKRFDIKHSIQVYIQFRDHNLYISEKSSEVSY